MSNPILVGLDREREDDAPLAFGTATARLTGAPLTVLAAYLHDPITDAVSGGMVDADLRGKALSILEARTSGMDVELLTMGGPSPAHVLHDAAVGIHPSLLVVGSTARGPIRRVAPGATAERLLHGAPCPVAIAPSGLAVDWEPRRVGVGFSDVEESHAALRTASSLARAAGATLRVTSAIDPRQSFESAVIAPYRLDGRLETASAGALRALDAALEQLQPSVRADGDVVVARPADALIELSSQVDLIVCGSRGYGPLRSGAAGRRHAQPDPQCALPRADRSPRVRTAARGQPRGRADGRDDMSPVAGHQRASCARRCAARPTLTEPAPACSSPSTTTA